MVTFVSDQKDQLQILSLGASLPLYTAPYFTIDGFKYSFDGEVISGKLKKYKLFYLWRRKDSGLLLRFYWGFVF